MDGKRDTEEVTTHVMSVLREHFAIDSSTVTSDSRLREDLDLDSIDLCDMIGVIEKSIGVSARLTDFMDARTVGDLVKTLELLAQGAPMS